MAFFFNFFVMFNTLSLIWVCLQKKFFQPNHCFLWCSKKTRPPCSSSTNDASINTSNDPISGIIVQFFFVMFNTLSLGFVCILVKFYLLLKGFTPSLDTILFGKVLSYTVNSSVIHLQYIHLQLFCANCKNVTIFNKFQDSFSTASGIFPHCIRISQNRIITKSKVKGPNSYELIC